MKAAVSPWDSSLVPVDAFRSPLSRAFSLLEEIRNHIHSDRYHFCLTATWALVQWRRFWYGSVLPQSKHRKSLSDSAALKQLKVRLMLGYRACVTSDAWFLSPPPSPVPSQFWVSQSGVPVSPGDRPVSRTAADAVGAA